ncbi:MAG: penicillin-binding protein 1A [Bdellovibrio sp.]|nr:penicillin-binding protein 1A [Methylotenera sp.]
MTPKKWWHFLILFLLVTSLSLAALSALALTLIYPTLPSLEALTNYQPKLPLRVYSAEGYLIGEFGEERRAFVKIDDVPKDLKNAVLAIEDRRFYQHHGIDATGVLRAIKNNLLGLGHEGASTITMQVAKNFFSTPGAKRGLVTKVKEALLAMKIEKALNKDQILELYLNQIYLGQRSYGFAAASQVYYSKPINKLTLAECALLAGLPKAPSGYNPYINPKRAIERQHDVLRDMHRYGMINDAQYNQAMQQKLVFKMSKQSRDFAADYVAEIVRQTLFDQYQESIYSSGMKVYTTIKKANQEAANIAVLQGILEYQRRQGYQKPEKNIDLSQLSADNRKEGLQTALAEFEAYNGFEPAIVTAVSAKSVTVISKKNESIDISGVGLSLLQKNLNEKNPDNHKIKVGSVVRIIKSQNAWVIVQLPQVESALVALDPHDGAVTALVGGFDFSRSKFNHVTQAWRQPGSSFKPFVYSAALEKGFTPASIVDDAPLSMTGNEVGSGEDWEPKNFDEHYSGPIRLRTALTKSKNMVSIRVLKKITPRYAQDYVTKFGFLRKDIPAVMSMALGAGSTTPWAMANGYAVFANGGYRITPHLIAKITDNRGNILLETHYPQAGKDAPRVIDARNAFLMTSIMQDVVTKGTAIKAKSLGRQDLAGKTGTTNDQHDAWFAGFNPKQVAITWIGYDQPRSLGKDETGGKAALPIWIRYMSTALRGVPDVAYSVPDGVIKVKINAATGALIDEADEGIYEYFYQENPPPTHENILPPLEELPPEFSENAPPSNMTDNPLQPQPPEIPEPIRNPPIIIEHSPNSEQTRPIQGPAQKNETGNSAARVMNPSGF